MTQEERWMQNYNEVMTFIESNHRLGTLNDTLNTYLIKHANELSKMKCVGDETLLRSLHVLLFLGERQPMNEFKLLLRSFDLPVTLDELKEMTDERIAEAIRQKKDTSKRRDS